MTLRHLNIFCVVCKEQSITLAAEKLNMTQPAVSIAIRELETFYNTQLFERMNRKIYITEPGRKLLQYSTNIINQFNESVDIIRNEKEDCKCRLGVNATVAETKLTYHIKNIEASIPKIDLRITIDNNESIEKMLVNNEIDFAIVDKIENSEKWNCKPIFDERMVVVCSPDKKKVTSLSELAGERLLLREKGSGNRNIVEEVFYRNGIEIVPYVESSSSLALIRMTQEGLGYTILPESVVNHILIEGSLVENNIKGVLFSRQFYLIYHKNKFLSNAMENVIDILS